MPIQSYVLLQVHLRTRYFRPINPGLVGPPRGSSFLSRFIASPPTCLHLQHKATLFASVNRHPTTRSLHATAMAGSGKTSGSTGAAIITDAWLHGSRPTHPHCTVPHVSDSSKASLSTVVKPFTFVSPSKTNKRMAGSSFLKLAIALHQYIEEPSWTPCTMTQNKDALFHRSSAQKKLRTAQVETGHELLEKGVEAAFQKASHYFPILKVHGTWQGLRAKYERDVIFKKPGQTTWGPHPLEQLFERTFRTKGLVHLALRHRSVSKGENNCRLQYVGDAVWDVAADLFWIRHCLAPEQAGPGKANTVSNKALSIMAVELGISELLEVGLSLGGCIDETVKKLQGMANKGSSFCQPENISSMKLFADEFEAVVGALFIDAGLDLAPVEAFFEKRVVPMLTKQLPQYAFQ